MKYIKRLLIIVLVIGAGAAVCMFYSPRHVMGEAAQALEVYYNVKKADAINSGQICVERDGETLNLTGSQRPYMTESMSLMIPITQVPRIFYSSVDVDRDKNLCFAANGHEVRISPETDGAVVDNKDTAFAEPMIWRNGRLYVSAALLAEAFGGSFSWDETTQTAVVTNAQSVPETLPKAYDMRDDERVTPVRDQGNLGTCWAFASLGALESSLMPGESYMFSPDHMSFMSGYNMTQQDGGDFNMALAYLTSWKGPVLENEDPYGDGVSDSSLVASVHLQEAVSIPAKDFDGIKAAIHQWGGVQSSFYSDMEFANSSSSSRHNSLPEPFSCHRPSLARRRTKVGIASLSSHSSSKSAVSRNPKAMGIPALVCRGVITVPHRQSRRASTRHPLAPWAEGRWRIMFSSPDN